VVFSTTLEKVEGNARLATSDVLNEIARLKEQAEKDASVGGAGFASTVIELGLIDECRLVVNPVVLGAGRPYFPAVEQRINLELIETRTFGSRVVYTRYRPGPRRATSSPGALAPTPKPGAERLHMRHRILPRPESSGAWREEQASDPDRPRTPPLAITRTATCRMLSTESTRSDSSVLTTALATWNALGLTETGFVGLSSNYTELV
jgi:hypothetical protein